MSVVVSGGGWVDEDVGGCVDGGGEDIVAEKEVGGIITWVMRIESPGYC